jgi:hypothetical protein
MPTQGRPERTSKEFLPPRTFDFKRNGTAKQQLQHSRLFKEFGLRAIALQKRLFPLQTHCNNKRMHGADCELGLQTFNYATTVHKDRDKRHAFEKPEIENRVATIEACIKNDNGTLRKRDLLCSMLVAQKSMVHSCFTTCTWMIEEHDDWEIFVYFVFPASKVALLISHECALTFKGSELWHGTTIPIAINKRTREVRCLGFDLDAEQQIGSINAWGRAGGSCGGK